jgi:hypothetical protein
VNEFDKQTNELEQSKGGAVRLNSKEYKKTSMHKSVTVFEEFVHKLTLHNNATNEL